MKLYTSDPHLGHDFVARTRGYDNANEADWGFVDAWVRAVRRDDIVTILGDLCLGNPAEALRLLAELPGRKRLIFGNHDEGHPMFRRGYRYIPEYLKVFESVAPFGRDTIAGHDVMLSHFPYAGDNRRDSRFQQYRLTDCGLPLLHGHIHSRWRGEGRIVHVGLDAWDGELVTENDIVERIAPEMLSARAGIAAVAGSIEP